MISVAVLFVGDIVSGRGFGERFLRQAEKKRASLAAT